MALNISGLNELRERLERLRAEEVMARALAKQAERVAARVRDGLSEPPGAAGHDEPWLQSGALRDSVGAQADGLQAAVGSSDPAAVPQEMGTHTMPPRPFLAPVAAGMGEDVAWAIGAEVAAALRGESGSSGAGDATPGVIQASATMPGAGAALFGLGAAAALGWALSRPSSTPNLPSPTRAPPLMNQPSPDGGKSSSPEDKGTDPVKPNFKLNDAHNPRDNNHNPNKDPEPPDSEEMYKDAQRDPNPDKEV